MASKKFRNLNVDFRDIMGLSVSQRLDMLRSDEGQGILANFTPAQLADMFPRYYSEKLPSVGKSLSRVSGGKIGEETAQTAQREIVQRKPVGGTSGTPTKLPNVGNTRVRSGAPESQQPSWMKKLEPIVPGISDSGAKAQLSREQKEVIEQLKKGAIAADDPRVAFMKDISDTDLKKAGIQRTEQGYSMSTTAASRMSEEEIKGNLRNSGTGGFTPRERATLDLIATREGSKDPNIIFGDSRSGGTGKYSRALGLDKRPLTDHSINEVLAMQRQLTQMTARDGVAGGRGTSAVGTGQMIRGTLESNLRALGIPQRDWDKIKFDKSLQERLTLQNFRSSGIGDPNADPSTWNTTRLGQQYESLDTSKGFRALTQTEINSVRNASSQRVNPNPTPEDIARERQRLEQEQQAGLAGSLIPKLPEGIDPKFAEQYNRLSPGQKQKVQEAIQKLGEGNVQAGTQKFNELYRTSPEKVTEVASRPSSGENLVEMRNQNARRNLPITGSLNDQLNYAATQAGVKVEVFSGGQERPFMINGKMTSPRHTAGGAADVKLYTMDEKGNKRYLDMRNPEDAAKMKKFTASAVHAGATGVGAGPGYMGNSSIHIGGGTTAAWGAGKGQPAAPWVSEALNEGLARRQSQPLNLEEWKKQQQEKRELPNNITQASPEAEKEERENTYRSRFGTPPQQKPVGGTSGTPTTLPDLGNPRVSSTVPTPQQQPPTATPEKKEESLPQQAFALGGETEAQGPLTAYAIDKDKMRRDDTIVTDGRVRFTMNSEKESMKYDPDTGQVKIDHARGEARQKINAGDLQPVEKQQEQAQVPQQEQQIVQNQVTQAAPVPQQLSNSYDVTQDLTNDIFKTSSFKRAVASSRFMKDSDPLGGHHDQGAYNIV